MPHSDTRRDVLSDERREVLRRDGVPFAAVAPSGVARRIGRDKVPRREFLAQSPYDKSLFVHLQRGNRKRAQSPPVFSFNALGALQTGSDLNSARAHATDTSPSATAHAGLSAYLDEEFSITKESGGLLATLNHWIQTGTTIGDPKKPGRFDGEELRRHIVRRLK